MKTRTSILAVLASGILLSSTGAALGVSGLASSGSAGNAQYQVTPSGTGQGPTVKGVSSKTAPTAAGQASGTSPAAVAQPSAQQSLDSGSELPFTGWAAIPVLLIGLMLLGAGVVMRRRTAGDPS